MFFCFMKWKASAIPKSLQSWRSARRLPRTHSSRRRRLFVRCSKPRAAAQRRRGNPMTISCKDRERIFLDGTPEEWAALENHSMDCAACAEEVRAWKNLSSAASELHQEWDSSALWPCIEQALAQQSAATKNSGWQRFFGSWNLGFLQWQTAAAALLLVALTASAIWFMANLRTRPSPDNRALLNDRAVNDVERAEAVYERAIDKLDAQARPQLTNSFAPLCAR